MSDLKTKKNDASVEEFLAGIENGQRREDCRTVVEMIKEVTGEDPAMWGDSIIGFGCYHYKYASGREGDWSLTGVSPRKQSLTLYVMPGFDPYRELLAKLGKHKTGTSCLYVNKLEDVDPSTLRTLVAESVEHMRRAHG